jgi:hypothetical protein
MYRELAANNEIHITHNLSTRYRMRREDRIWDHVDDLNLTSKIELRYSNIKGVQ